MLSSGSPNNRQLSLLQQKSPRSCGSLATDKCVVSEARSHWLTELVMSSFFLLFAVMQIYDADCIIYRRERERERGHWRTVWYNKLARLFFVRFFKFTVICIFRCRLKTKKKIKISLLSTLPNRILQF